MAGRMRGEVVTFYSYKGGVGRTMALANVACALAEQYREPVLTIDWDLEAPGLYRFFESLPGRSSPWAGEGGRSDQPGLLELFEALSGLVEGREVVSETQALAAVDAVDLSDFLQPTGTPNVTYLGPGRLDDEYAARVNNFPWVRLYEQAPDLFRVFAERLTQRFRFVLIDSRTGLTDTAGICTMLLPDKLVLVFTPTRQGLTGVMDLVKRATEYRRESTDLRPLVVYPLASRIDVTEEELRREWRFGDGLSVQVGYQRQFEDVLQQAYELPTCNLTGYFDEVAIQHVPSYAYGEQIAVLVEPKGDRLSLARSYRRFTAILAAGRPWDPDGTQGTITAGGSLFVNRHQEQRALVDALRSDAPRCLLVAGEAGTGKTALLQRFAELAKQEGAAVVSIDLTNIISASTFIREIAAQSSSETWSSGLLNEQVASYQVPRSVQPSPADVEDASQGAPTTRVAQIDLAWGLLARLARSSRGRAVLLLDDVDLAYPDVRDLITTGLTSRGRGRGTDDVLLVLAGRAVEHMFYGYSGRAGSAWGDDEDMRVLRLGPLSRTDLEVLLNDRLGDGYAAAERWLVDLLSERMGKGLSLAAVLRLADLLLVDEPVEAPLAQAPTHVGRPLSGAAGPVARLLDRFPELLGATVDAQAGDVVITTRSPLPRQTKQTIRDEGLKWGLSVRLTASDKD